MNIVFSILLDHIIVNLRLFKNFSIKFLIISVTISSIFIGFIFVSMNHLLNSQTRIWAS